MAVDPKPMKRKRDPRVTTKINQLRCRVCGRRPVTAHHLVPRSLGGDDVAENLVPLCGSGTTGCHGLVENRDTATCMVLRYMLRAEEIAYVIEKKGAPFLARYYPETVAP